MDQETIDNVQNRTPELKPYWIDYVNNVQNRTPPTVLSADTIRNNAINERLNREPPTGLISPTREEPPTGLIPPSRREPRRINPFNMYYEEETSSVPRSMDDAIIRTNTLPSRRQPTTSIDLLSTTPLADRKQNSRIQPTTSIDLLSITPLADRKQNLRGQPAPELRTPNLAGRNIPLALPREDIMSSPLDYLEQPASNLERQRQVPSRRAPPIPQSIQVNPQKEQLCVQLFGRSNNGCLDLTMEQLETMRWAMDNGVYQRTGNETYQTILPVVEHNGRIRSVIGCLLELANKYGLVEINRGRLTPKETFAKVYYAIHNLHTSSEAPQTIYQRMLDARQSISDEAFAAIPWTDAGFDTRTSLIVKSINPPTGFDFLATFAPELYSARWPHQLGQDTGLRKKMLEIYDCLISIMLQLYPQLGNRGGKLKRKRNKKSHKKRKGKPKRRKTKRKY